MTRAMISQIDHPEVSYEIDWVSTYEEALDAFDRCEYDVYLVDYFLEDRDGLELVRQARARGLREPVIMLTGRGSREVDLQAMEAGASDYLVKGKIDPDLLERTIRYALERQRAEAALRASEQRHRSMFDHLPIGLYRVSPEGDFMDANPALIRILGYPDPRTLQESYASTLYVNPDDRPAFEELLEQIGVARGFETELTRHDGQRIRVRNTARAHRGPDGEIRYLEGAVEDVTEERSAREVVASAERFQTVFRHSRLAILLVEIDGTVRAANPAARDALGFESGDVEGVDLLDLVAPVNRNRVASDLTGLAAGEDDVVVGERRFIGGDGIVLWARTRVSLVRDPVGEPDHLMFLLEDVAETGEHVGAAD